MADQGAASVETLEAVAAVFNVHDLDAIMEFFVEDCSLDMPRGPSRGAGAWSARRRSVKVWPAASRACPTSITATPGTGSAAISVSPSGC